MNQQQEMIKELIDWYEALTPDSLDQIDRYYTQEIHFKDPFHEFVDRNQLYRIYQNMFQHLEAPRFQIDSWTGNGDQAALQWQFVFSYRQRVYTIHGASHLRLAEDGRVWLQRDYWDPASGIYEQIPVFGVLLRTLRRWIVRGSMPGKVDNRGHSDVTCGGSNTDAVR